MSDFISFIPAGRLGNWMFECAAALAYSEKYGANFYATSSPYIKYFPSLPNYSPGKFNSPEWVTSMIWREPSHAYMEIPNLNCRYAYLQGYFQSYKYFDWCKDKIINAFGWKKDFTEDFCSIHIRRSDYLRYPTKHPVVTEEYLDEAISRMSDDGVKYFLFFGDDPDWIKKYASNKKIVWALSEGNSEIDDMKAMSKCRFQIISNSTFSYWAAYLNQNENKKIITPHEDNWFGPDNNHLDVKDLLPPDWIRIKY